MAMPGDFDPRDSADPRDHDNFDIYDGRWLDDPRDQDDRDLDLERDRGSRDHDLRDAFVEGLELPRGVERELVQDDREYLYELNREDSLTLATIGAFRVVAERDLATVHDRDSGSHHDTLDHLRDEGLIRFVSVSEDARAAVLTDDGRDLLEANRRERGDDNPRQEFHAGVSHPRELQHDSALFEAYLAVEERLRDQGAEIERVVLEVDLRREYQEWLQEHNKGNPASDGRPDRDPREIETWARDHDLPYIDEHVRFPDFRVEYERDGQDRHEDVEVMSEHYRGAYAAAKGQAGFTCYVAGSARSGGSSGAPFDPRVAEDFL
jgi:DNA-binding PadR family transcriptional regulator